MTATGQARGMSKVVVPLVVFLVFTTYSVLVSLEHGPLGFIPAHSVGGWPTQVFLDLGLMAVGFLTLAAPDARRRGITFWPYLLATLTLGSIGMLAYFVRRGLGREPVGG